MVHPYVELIYLDNQWSYKQKWCIILKLRCCLTNHIYIYMVYDDGKGVYYTAKDKYGESVLKIPPTRRYGEFPVHSH